MLERCFRHSLTTVLQMSSVVVVWHLSTSTHGNLVHGLPAVLNQISVCRGTLNEELFKSADEPLENHGMPSALLSLHFSTSYSKYLLSNACFRILPLGAKLWSKLRPEEERNVRAYVQQLSLSEEGQAFLHMLLTGIYNVILQTKRG